MKSTLIFLGFSAFALAHKGLKSRLAQLDEEAVLEATTGAPAPVPVVAGCVCTLPGGSGSGFPALTQASYNSFNQAGSISSGNNYNTVPDTEVLT